jgi:N-acetylneuraminate synthase/sialic acid synthase
MVRDLRRTHAALGSPEKRRYESEVQPILKMAKKLVAARDLPAGHVLREADLAAKSPADGMPPSRLDEVVGRALTSPLALDATLQESHLGEPRLPAAALAYTPNGNNHDPVIAPSS